MIWKGGVIVFVLAGSVCFAQMGENRSGVAGYVGTAEITALAPAGASSTRAPETETLLGKLGSSAKVTLHVQLAKSFSRFEILSDGFILPRGTLVLHEAGARHYVIADPKAKTFVIMDAGKLVGALEGSLGVVNTEYQARARHTHEIKQIAGIPCHKAIVEVTYASSIPFESDKIVVAQKNAIEIWHAPPAVPTAALEHLLFKYQQDRTGQLKRVLSQDIGFPMEVRCIVTPAATDARQTPQAGSFEMKVTVINIDRNLDPELFRLPPAGYRQLERNPYFAAATSASRPR
jgi:hypothetical protein